MSRKNKLTEGKNTMDYKELSKDIIKNVGDVENVSSLTHCATRLRFNLKDDSKAATDILKNTKGVMGGGRLCFHSQWIRTDCRLYAVY